MPVDSPGVAGGPSVPSAELLDLLGRLLLHAGHPHATESSNTVGMEYVAASAAFVGIVGGLLYWYLGMRAEMR